MKWFILTICLLLIAAAALDVHCAAASAAPNVIVLACKAGRL